MKKNRRKFVIHTGLAVIVMSTFSIQSTLGKIFSVGTLKNKISFVSPIDGDMLNEYDGTVADGCLLTQVKVLAPSVKKIKINGVTANYEDGMYVANIRLKDYKNTIEVKDVASGEKQSILVFWLKNYTNKYRLSLDDNIWFLKDISKNADKYKSIFENPYLGLLKQVHDTYGTKIHLNIFYQTDGFNLSQMTDQYKNEWKENAGWLRLSFHALQEFPDKPYIHAGYNEVKRDCEMVLAQIRRFAGEEVMGPVTTIHWGEANVDGCRALKDLGYKALVGYFRVDPDPVSYYLDLEKVQHVNNRFIWRDNHKGLIFSKIAIVLDKTQLEQIVPNLDNLKSNLHKPAFIDLLIHEQYFHPTYKDYQPDYSKKILTAVKWAADNGYQPAFLSECIFK
jgi:hypothetical protein